MSGMSFSFDIKAFSGKLLGLKTGSKKTFKRNLMALGWQLHSLTAMRTPIDTGQARRGWAAPEMTESGDRLEVFITNEVEYIVALEFGHSQQAPTGMLRNSMREIAGSFGQVIFKDLGK